MRYILLLFIIFFFNCGNREDSEQEKGQIKVISRYCKYDIENAHLRLDFKLFKNDSEKTEIIVSDDKKNIIEDLPFGDYYIEFKSIFNKKNTVEFKVSETELKTIPLCFDFLDYESNKNVLLIDELKAEQTLKYWFESLGCFDSHSDKLIISKTESGLIAEYKNAEYNLTETQIRLLKEFEAELRSNHIGGCSRTDKYGIMNEQTLELYVVNDESCQWRGFENLVELLEFEK